MCPTRLQAPTHSITPEIRNVFRPIQRELFRDIEEPDAVTKGHISECTADYYAFYEIPERGGRDNYEDLLRHMRTVFAWASRESASGPTCARLSQDLLQLLERYPREILFAFYVAGWTRGGEGDGEGSEEMELGADSDDSEN